eukprot:232175_1
MIHYSGHGDEDGDWCFFDGYITFEWIYEQLITYQQGKNVHIYCDCCFSGNWTQKLFDKKLNKNITKEWQMMAPCSACKSAYDNELVRMMWVDGCRSWNGAKLKEAMAKRGGVLYEAGKLLPLINFIYYY